MPELLVTLLAWATFLIAFWTMLPQIASIQRYSHDPAALRGVSLLSLAIITVDYVGWSAYGLLTQAWAIWIPSLFGVGATLVTIIMLIRARSGRAHTHHRTGDPT